MIPAIVATCLLVPVVILFVYFAIRFYKTLAHHRYAIFQGAMTELDQMVKHGGMLRNYYCSKKNLLLSVCAAK